MKGEHYSGRTRSTGTVVFYSIYFVLLAAALSAAVVGLGKLWEFLQHYEACQIYHTIDAVAEELNSGNLVLLYSGIEGDISPYEGEGAARRQLSERLTGEFTLKKNIKESTKENPVYTVLCGGSLRRSQGLPRPARTSFTDSRYTAWSGSTAFSWCRTRT